METHPHKLKEEKEVEGEITAKKSEEDEPSECSMWAIFMCEIELQTIFLSAYCFTIPFHAIFYECEQVCVCVSIVVVVAVAFFFFL